MAKPITLPRFAETGGGSAAVNITAPSSGQADTGWTTNQIPTSANMNFLHYWVYQWVKYLNTLEAEALTWTALQTFTGGASFQGVTSTPGLSASAASHASGVGGYFVATSTAGSVGLRAATNAGAGAYAIKAEVGIANGTAVLITSTAGASVLANGLNVGATYGGTAISASTTKAASGATPTYAISGTVSASATATAAIDAGMFGWGGTGIGTGLYGLSGLTGAGYGVKGEAGSITAYGVYGLGASGGTTGGPAGLFTGGSGSTTGGIGVRIDGGAGTGSGDANTGLLVVGGAAAGAGAAGQALSLQPGTSASGANADALGTVNAAGITAANSAYGIRLAAGHEIKFSGTRTAYSIGTNLPNVVTAGNIVNSRVFFTCTTASGAQTLTGGRNIASVTASSTSFLVTFSGNYATADYSVFMSSNLNFQLGWKAGSKTVGAFEMQVYDSAGVLIDPTTLATTIKFDVMVVGEMA